MCTDSFLLQFILIGFCHSLTVSHSHATFTFNSYFPLHFAVFYFYSTLVITLHLHGFCDCGVFVSYQSEIILQCLQMPTRCHENSPNMEHEVDQPLSSSLWHAVNTHTCIKSIHSPIQIIKFRCSISLPSQVYNVSTQPCRLLRQRSVKEWLAFRSSLHVSVVSCQDATCATSPPTVRQGHG